MPNSTRKKLLVMSSWAAIGFIAYATLTHVEFVYAIYYKLAPLLSATEMKMYAHVEHILAFAVLGAMFSFAYPRRIFLVCFIVFGCAVLLEFLQTLTPDRHGTLVDAMEKIAGAAAGVVFAKIVLNVFQQRREQVD